MSAPNPDPDTLRAVEAAAEHVCCGGSCLFPDHLGLQCDRGSYRGDAIAAIAAYHEALGQHEAAARVRQCKQGEK